jgi:hypothetical protein
MASFLLVIKINDSTASVTKVIEIPNEELDDYVCHDRNEIIKEHAEKAAHSLIERTYEVMKEYIEKASQSLLEVTWTEILPEEAAIDENLPACSH